MAAGSGQVAPSTAALSHAMLYATATGRRPAQIWKLGARADAFSCALRSARNRRSGRPSDPRPGHAQWFALIRAQCACSRRYARPEGRRCPQPVGCRWNTLSCMTRAWIACRGGHWWSAGGHRPVTRNSIAPAPAGCGPRSWPVPASREDRRRGGRRRASGPPPRAKEVSRPAPGRLVLLPPERTGAGGHLWMTLPARWARGSSAGERDSVSQLPRSSLAARRPRRWAPRKRPAGQFWRRSRCRT